MVSHLLENFCNSMFVDLYCRSTMSSFTGKDFWLSKKLHGNCKNLATPLNVSPYAVYSYIVT